MEISEKKRSKAFVIAASSRTVEDSVRVFGGSKKVCLLKVKVGVIKRAPPVSMDASTDR